ncbi:MAG: hypothetical protein QGI33_01805 [Candidatus Brocadiia bacterium]|nr:hypothetical protein [Candidatus Brocadiia bacterium]
MKPFAAIRPTGTRDRRRGAAMTETALLCLFLYAPVLMMVIIWGDMSLDKERAHVAAAYMAFATEPLGDADLMKQFFPTATSASDATRSVRSVAVEVDEAVEGPLYTLPDSYSDYPGGWVPPHDLQYRLYGLAFGEWRILWELQPMPDGTLEMVPRMQRSADEVATYLNDNDIVNVGALPYDPAEATDTPAISSDYTHYVEALTDMFNGPWAAGGGVPGRAIPNAAPTLESQAGLRTRFLSPFLWELEREPLGRGEPDLDLPREGGAPGFEMHFGASASTPDDDSFKTGYTYLRNPAAGMSSDADISLLGHLYSLSYRMFDRNGLQVYNMPVPLSIERGDADVLKPGDFRPDGDGEPPPY